MSSKQNQSGQAVLEYLLILITIVAVAQILYQFNRAFRSWGEDYFVSYYRCLLETGELPGPSGEATAGLCEQEYQPFTWSAGRPPASGGAGGNGSGGSGGSGAGRGRNRDKVETSAGGSSGSNRGSELSKASGGGGGGGSGRIGKFGAGKSSASGGGGVDVASKQKDNYTGSTKAMSASAARGSTTKQDKDKLDNAYGVVKNDQERGEEKSSVSVKVSKDAGEKKDLMKVNRKVASKSLESEDEGFTIGVFLRFLIIAAIVIALLMLIGGQILQITKGMDSE